MIYRDQNQVDTKIKVRRKVVGTMADDHGTPIPDACVGLFSEPDHKLLNATKTKEEGTFVLPGIKYGTYRIMAEYDNLGIANSLLVVGSRGHKKIKIRMRSNGIDTTSFVEGSSPK